MINHIRITHKEISNFNYEYCKKTFFCNEVFSCKYDDCSKSFPPPQEDLYHSPYKEPNNVVLHDGPPHPDPTAGLYDRSSRGSCDGGGRHNPQYGHHFMDQNSSQHTTQNNHQLTHQLQQSQGQLCNSSKINDVSKQAADMIIFDNKPHQSQGQSKLVTQQISVHWVSTSKHNPVSKSEIPTDILTDAQGEVVFLNYLEPSLIHHPAWTSINTNIVMVNLSVFPEISQVVKADDNFYTEHNGAQSHHHISNVYPAQAGVSLIPLDDFSSVDTKANLAHMVCSKGEKLSLTQE